MISFPERQPNDELVAAKRVTGHKLAAAWGLALLVLAGLALLSVADIACRNAEPRPVIDAAALVRAPRQCPAIGFGPTGAGIAARRSFAEQNARGMQG